MLIRWALRLALFVVTPLALVVLLAGADSIGTVKTQGNGIGTFTTANASAVTATTQVLGVSGAALSYYVTDVVFSCGATASTVSLISSTTAGNACATAPTVVVPTVPLAINGSISISLKTPVKVTANSALCCKTSGSTAFSCLLSGFVAP